jgi:predicted small metal-binding protein
MADRVRVDCRKYPSEKGCTVAVSGTLEEVVELAWLHAKMHHDHEDNEEKDVKDWIRANAEPAED